MNSNICNRDRINILEGIEYHNRNTTLHKIDNSLYWNKFLQRGLLNSSILIKITSMIIVINDQNVSRHERFLGTDDICMAYK